MRNPFRRERTEARSILDLPWNTGAAPHTAVTQDRALSLIPVYSANRLLAGTVSTLPLKAYRRVGDERQPMSAMPQLFRQLEEVGELQPWLHRCMTSLGLRGNAYGLITSRDGMQFPSQIEWLNPTEVSVDDTVPGRPAWFWRGRRVEREDVLHIPWFTLPGQTQGLSPIGAFAATINAGLSAGQYGADWFAAGGVPPGKFKNTQQTVTQDQATAIKARLLSAIRTREPLVYGADWEYEPLSVAPAEAQFIESQKLTATQIASIYGIPPEMIGGESGNSLTYANVEQQQINFLMLTLRPWLVTLEHAFSAILPDRQYVRFNGDAVIRADIKTRWETYRVGLETGVLSRNEVRQMEDRAPIPGGDAFTPVQQSQSESMPVPGVERMMWRVPS